jgi:2-polyprenyl-3-methyl-5-hydroxy-6-metoxy-1,4-benzoquinol methylase
LTQPTVSEYRYSHAGCNCAHDYLLPAITHTLADLQIRPRRAFDLGCGNGSVASWLASQDYDVSGIDPSETGIAEANRAFPTLDLRVGSAYDPLHKSFGQFPLVISLEVVEHVYSPRDYARCIQQLLLPKGYALISTPYHGYLKNLALAVTGQWDSHFTALWDHGHIKFWSPKTITTLLTETGLVVHRIIRVGRIPQLAKSMLVIAQQPG